VLRSFVNGSSLITELTESHSQSYFLTGGLPPLIRFGDKPLETHDQCFFQLNTCGHSSYVIVLILSDERMGLSFTVAAGPRQRTHSQVRVTRDSWPHFTVSFRDSPNLEGQVPVFMCPRNRVAELYPQALGSLPVASYDLQGYGGGIRSRLHTGY
jgi:hypothetical protein